MLVDEICVGAGERFLMGVSAAFCSKLLNQLACKRRWLSLIHMCNKNWDIIKLRSEDGLG